MAANDMLESFLGAIPHEQKEQLKGLIKDQRSEMFAARSEDARVRLAHEFIHHVREFLKKK
jgi:hypothetical protein